MTVSVHVLLAIGGGRPTVIGTAELDPDTPDADAIPQLLEAAARAFREAGDAPPTPPVGEG